MTTLNIDNITAVRDQKREEDRCLSSKGPKPKLTPMLIDVHSAPTCFDKARVILSSMQGCIGIPLTYVIRLNIKPKQEKGDPRFGETNCLYGSIGKEMVARAPIIARNIGSRTSNELEISGPFTPAFSSYMKKVYVVLHSLLGSNTAWQHVKKYQQGQNGRMVWRVIHGHFFGGYKATALCQQTLSRLSTLKYDGNSNPRNWSFDKYMTTHVAQHNILHSLHMDYGVDPVSEMMKIKYYQDRITDPIYNLVCLSIQINPHLLTAFDQVKDHYTVFKQTTSAQDNPGTVRRGISSFGQGGLSRGRGGGGRGGGSDHDARKPLQNKIDACTHIKSQRYDSKEYRAFTPAKKTKHWQLMNPTRTPRGVGHDDHQRTGSRGGGGQNFGRGYAYLSDGMTHKTPPSAISETSTKRSKYNDTAENETDLFPTTNKESTTSNRKNKALTRSSPYGRQANVKSNE